MCICASTTIRLWYKLFFVYIRSIFTCMCWSRHCSHWICYRRWTWFVCLFWHDEIHFLKGFCFSFSWTKATSVHGNCYRIFFCFRRIDSSRICLYLSNMAMLTYSSSISIDTISRFLFVRKEYWNDFLFSCILRKSLFRIVFYLKVHVGWFPKVILQKQKNFFEQ